MIEQRTLCQAIRIPRNCQPEKTSSKENRAKKYSLLSLALFTFDFRILGSTIFFEYLVIEFSRQNHLSFSSHLPNWPHLTLPHVCHNPRLSTSRRRTRLWKQVDLYTSYLHYLSKTLRIINLS